MSDDPHGPFGPVGLGGGPSFAARVQALLSMGQVDRACHLATEAIAARPSDPDAHFMLALAASSKGDSHVEQALEITETVLRLAPTFDPVHLLRAQLLLSRGRFAESERWVRSAIELEPGEPAYHSFYAELLSACDRDVEALARCEHALSLDPDQSTLHRQRAALLMAVHPSQWQISEDAVRTALRMAPYHPDNHAILGFVLLKKGDHEGAENAFRDALRRAPSHPLAIRGLSELMKGQTWFYWPMLMYGQWMGRLSTNGQLGVVFGLWVIYSSTRAVLPDQFTGSDLMSLAWLSFCAYTWFSEPVTRWVLRQRYPWLV